MVQNGDAQMEPEEIEGHQTIVATEIGRGINAFETSLRYLRKTLVGLFYSALVRSGGQKIDGDLAGSRAEKEPNERYGLLQMTDILLRNLDAKQVFNVSRNILVHQARCADGRLGQAIHGLLKKFNDALEVRNVLAHSACDFRVSNDTGHRDTSRILLSRVTRRDGPGYETRDLTFNDLLEATSFLKAIEIRMADLSRLVVDMGQLDLAPEEDFDAHFAKIWTDDIIRWLETPTLVNWPSAKLEDDPIAL
jgi:hypothetical protein